ncbi:hypothetical protein TEA_021846 [Camellia sinensis var. sinensis]|uniref:CDP-diacylglycerol--serine O-phosphatidyltransferase n=1 Tax=Camellia sinensis var. sinensis TaxID=542762 RepID=A0A4S4ED73_CAMSN|nr:hypothetical protein TEA_021846 [Camellia sinensis var. sinensis]
MCHKGKHSFLLAYVNFNDVGYGFESAVGKWHFFNTGSMELNGDRRARRKDRTAQENGDVRSLASAEELDPWTAWAYKPRTISLLLVGACFLIWASGALDPENSSSGDIITSVKRGVWAMIAVFLAYCLLQAPSTILIRPHPAIWRLVHGMAVIYLVALTFLLFQWLVIIGGGGGEDQGWLRDGGVAVKDLEHLRVGVVMEVLLWRALLTTQGADISPTVIWSGKPDIFKGNISCMQRHGCKALHAISIDPSASEVCHVGCDGDDVELKGLATCWNRDDARQFMKFLHPDLGVELPERSYGADCRIYVPENPTNRFKNVYDTLFDEFVPAHIFGWWGKAIMIRNQPLLWVLSIGFELMELTFRHMLPNFNECWWDSIILDILICNWFGETLDAAQLFCHN